jgi:hypothetical protein
MGLPPWARAPGDRLSLPEPECGGDSVLGRPKANRHLLEEHGGARRSAPWRLRGRRDRERSLLRASRPSPSGTGGPGRDARGRWRRCRVRRSRYTRSAALEFPQTVARGDGRHGVDHHTDQGSRRQRREQPQSQTDTSQKLGATAYDGVDLSRVITQRGKPLARGTEAVATEYAEEFLGAVPRHQQTEPDSDEEQTTVPGGYCRPARSVGRIFRGGSQSLSDAVHRRLFSTPRSRGGADGPPRKQQGVLSTRHGAFKSCHAWKTATLPGHSQNWKTAGSLPEFTRHSGQAAGRSRYEFE